MKLASREYLDKLACSKVGGKVCSAFKKVDRKLFVPDKFESYAYEDISILLGRSSSISQPSLVAEMIDLLKLKGDEKVLEIGTGSGYSSAVLSFCCRQVYTIENHKKLAKSASERLKKLGYKNVEIYEGDGKKGLSEKAPFDAIVLTAAVKEIPSALIIQLKEEGGMVIPVEIKDSNMQKLFLCLKEKNRLNCEAKGIVRFVPLNTRK